MSNDPLMARTLEDVLAWCRSHSPALRVDEVITQDEFTHDVVVKVADSRYYVFGVT